MSELAKLAGRQRNGLRGMKTEALQKIVDHQTKADRERAKDSRYPFGGRISITGIGAVPVKAIEEVLAERA